MSPPTPSRDRWRRVFEAIRLARFEPYDTSAPEGRSKERYRRAILATLTSFGARGIRILTSLISIPLTIHYLGSERFGMWLTLNTTITFFAVLDLGVGNCLINLISEAWGREDRDGARRAVSNGLFLTAAIACGAVGVFVLVHPHMSWPRFFNVSTPLAVLEAPRATAVFFGCLAASVIVRLSARVNQGLQDIHVNNAWDAGSNLLALAGIILCIQAELGLPWLVLFMAGAPVLGGLGNGASLLIRRRPWIRPAVSDLSVRDTVQLVRIGAWFWAIQVGYLLVMNSTNLIVTHALGPDQVPEVAVPAKLFAMLAMVSNLIVLPLWGAYSESIARGDFAWAKRTLSRSLKVTLSIGLLPTLVLVALGQTILLLWVGDVVSPSLSLLFALGTWYLLLGFDEALGVFLNGANAVRAHALIRLWHASLAIGLQVVAVRAFGLEGLVWALVIAEVLGRLLPSAVLASRVLNRLTSTAQGVGDSVV